MAGTIGIKIANGDFYPILEENSSVKKRLVLTTVHDGQESVQIDLFRSLSQSMLDAQYVGTLVVENIKPLPKEEPSIELVISSGQDGTISADASILASSSDHNLLNVSLKAMDTPDQEDNFPDFDLERSEMQPPAGLYDTGGKNRKFPWLIMVLATVFVVVTIALLWFFFLGGREILPSAIKMITERPVAQTQPLVPTPVEAPPPKEEIPSPPLVEPAPPVEQAPVVVVVEVEVPPVEALPVEEAPVAAAPVEEVPVIQAPVAPPPARSQVVERTRPPAPVSSYRVPALIPRNGAPYQIQWGDTLWDISEAFYRNPWLYPRIARFNDISNPDLIVSGRTIRIPPLN